MNSEWDNYFYANYDLDEYSDKEEKAKLMTEIYLRKVSIVDLYSIIAQDGARSQSKRGI